jgi:DNA-binding CsgD family transcriptional regulator
VLLAAWQGREAEALGLIDATANDVGRCGAGAGLIVSRWASAQLYTGLGRYEEALAASEQAAEHAHDPTRVLPELIEAAVRCGKRDRAAAALLRLSEATAAIGSEWALGVEARSRALLSESDAAEELFREAIERLERTRVRVELARAHLLYGEWLRRERRRLDAREQLRSAHEMFASMGAEGFAARAARELLATGESARKRTVETSDQLTAQEAQIAQLARDGLSNPEIAVRLFISSRTVEYHMHKIFAKLNISTRHQLDRVLFSDRDPAQPG